MYSQTWTDKQMDSQTDGQTNDRIIAMTPGKTST